MAKCIIGSCDLYNNIILLRQRREENSTSQNSEESWVYILHSYDER